MRNPSICAAGITILALAGACSDGSELLGGGGMGNTAMPNAGTNATGPIGGDTSSGGSGTMPMAGAAPLAGSGMVVGGSGGMNTGGSGNNGGSADNGGSGGGAPDPYSGPFKILVLSTTLEFPHDSIAICQLMLGIESKRAAVEQDRGKTEPPNLGATPDAMMPQGTKPGSQWTADLATDDLAQFTEENLKNYAMVFSCNPTGTVFSNNPKVANAAAAMSAMQKFVEGGGAWAGVHSASDFEKQNGFPWFINTLVGGYFDHHDNDGTPGTVQVQSAFATHPVMRGVQATWSTQDEWYYMNRDVSQQPGFQIISRLASDNRPVTWIKDVGDAGGRMFYTIKGHNKSVYEEPDFRKLVLNGILWATHRLE